MTSLEALLPRFESGKPPQTWRSARAPYWAILALAAVVRMAQLDAQCLTMDELKDLRLARGGWSAIRSSEDRFPPLYHLMLHGWLRVMPGDETGRGFSAFCGILTVAVVTSLGALVAGRQAGYWAGGIAALAPYMTWYSLESRAYGLYMLLGAVAIWQFTVARQTELNRNWTWFAVACIAGVYVHYYFGLLIACAGLLFLGTRPHGRSLRVGLFAFALIAVACVPAWFLLQGDLDQPWGYAKTSRFSLAALAYTYFSFLSGYALGPSLRDLHAMTAVEAAAAAAPWILALGGASAVLLALAARTLSCSDAELASPGEAQDVHKRPWRTARWIAWMVAFCLAPPALVGAVSALGGFGYNARHAVWACVPLYVLLGVGLSGNRRRPLRFLAGATLGLAFGCAHYNRLVTADHQNEDMWSAADFISAFDEQAPVFVLSGYMADPLQYYLADGRRAYPLPSADTGRHESPAAMNRAVHQIRHAVPPGGVFWLVYSREFHGDPDGTMLAKLTDEFALTPQHSVAGARLYLGRSK